MKERTFPEGFLWGTASSSFQIEGAAHEGGRGETIWDRYSAIPGNILNGDVADVSCDHYHRFREDVAIMKELGMKAYRFSVAWSRILPEGRGAVNEEGIAFYSNLVDALLESGITPYLTLYHWDLPQALQDLGGWSNPDMPGYFAEYARILYDRLGDRVHHFITLNEPYCAAFLGNYEGRMAPGLHDFSTAVRVAYHLYLAHGLAVRAFRESGIPGEIGIALNLMGRLPLTDSPEDVAAARRADGYLNRWFAEPLLLGRYPQDMIDWYREHHIVLPAFREEDLTLMSQPLDFVGLNYYNDFWVRSDPTVWPLGFRVVNPKGVTTSDREWPFTEAGFTRMLLRMQKEWGVKRILITENGISFHDVKNLDGHVADGARQDYLRRHIRAMRDAMDQGVNVIGYFVWSLTDNFEWADGYRPRFGIVHVDFNTQERTIKDSGWFMAEVARRNSIW